MPIGAICQSRLDIISIDTTKFPNVSARIYLLDGDGGPLIGPTGDEVSIHENGTVRDLVGIDCGSQAYHPALSVALSFDVSGSMMYGLTPGNERISFAREAACAVVRSIPNIRTAVQTSQNWPSLIQDYTLDTGKAIGAILRFSLPGSGGNGFAMQLLDGNIGLLSIAQRGAGARTAVMFTDAEGDAFDRATLEQCIQICRTQGIRFYAMIFHARDATSTGLERSLQELALASGGEIFDNLLTRDDARKAAATLAHQLQGIDPCTLTWRSGEDCSTYRKLSIAIPRHALSADTFYLAPGNPLPVVTVTPAGIEFGAVAPGSSRDTLITLKAIDRSVTISSIRTDNPNFSIIDGAAPPGFTLLPGMEHAFTLRFTPADSGYDFTRIEIESSTCGHTVAYASGGYPGSALQRPMVHVVTPNGGERFAVGDRLQIRWSGIVPTVPVALDYSIDSGTTWLPIASPITGGSYQWTVPNTPSTRCLARVTMQRPDSGLLLRGTNSPVGDVRITADGAMVIAGGRSARLYDIQTGRLITTILNITPPPAIDTINVARVAISPDARYALLNGSDIFDLLTGTFIRRIPHGGLGCVMSRDWRRMLSGPILAKKDSMLRMIDVASGTVLDSARAGADYGAMAFSPDGARFVAATDDQVEVWSCSPLQPIRAFPASRGRGGAACADISPDGTRVLGVVGDNLDTVRIWNTADGTVVASLAMRLPAPFTLHQFFAAHFSPDGRSVATAGTEQRSQYDGAEVVALWDAGSGTMRRAFDVQRASYAAISRFGNVWISPDGQRVVVTGGSEGDATASVWYIGSAGLSDRSDSLWAIVAPTATVADLDFGRVMLGGGKDSVVQMFLHNDGAVAMHVKEVRIGGGTGDFSILSRTTSFDLAPGASQAMEFRFAPGALGRRAADVQIVTATGTISRTIRGEGVTAAIEIVAEAVDLGSVALGDRRDTTVTVLVRNIGTLDVALTGAVLLGPDTDAFSILSAPPALLEPGGTYAATLRFAPRSIGQTSCLLGILHDAPGSPTVVQLLGMGTGGRIRIPSDSGRPGDGVELRLLIDGPTRYMVTAGAQRFSATLGFDAALLAPSPSIAGGSLSGGSIVQGRRLVTINGSWDGTSPTLGLVPLQVLLGDTVASELELRTFRWLDAQGAPLDIDLTTESGRFHLTGLCPQGGLRLVEGRSPGALKVSGPNPASSLTSLSCVLDEDGITRLEVVDGSGRTLISPVNGLMHAGTYTIQLDLSALGSGRYYCVLRTPTRIVCLPLEVLK
jgi:WD40 repeat protein